MTTIVTTPPPPPGPVPFDKLFSQSWAVFKRNWTIALPPVIAGAITIAGIIAFVIIALVVTLTGAGARGHVDSGVIVALLLGYLALMVVAIALGLWGYVAMFGMADAAWTRGTATFGDGFAAFRECAGTTFVAWLGIFGLAICALILALPTLGIALLAFPVVIMYVMPSVVVGRRGGFEAIGESFRLVRRFFAQSAITALVLYAIAYGISLLGTFAILPVQTSMMPAGSDVTFHVPPIPLIAGAGIAYLLSIVASMAYYGFVATVLVGMYRDLISQPEPVPAPVPAMPAPFPPQQFSPPPQQPPSP